MGYYFNGNRFSENGDDGGLFAYRMERSVEDILQDFFEEQTELESELAHGDAAAEALIRHMQAMGADNLWRSMEIEGVKYSMHVFREGVDAGGNDEFG